MEMSTSSSTNHRAAQTLVADPIDALIPPAQSRLRRGLIGLIALSATIAVGLLWASGALFPAPFARTSFDGSSGPTVDVTTGRVTIGSYFVNYSVRDLELDDVDVALAGATVTSVWDEEASGDDRSEDRPIPAIIQSGSQAFLMIELEIEDCPTSDASTESSDEAWGVAVLSFRFPNNILPFARTETLDVGSLADHAQACALVKG